MRRTWPAATALVAVTALLAGCGGGGPGSGGGRISGGKISLGVLTDLSGVYADLAGPHAVAAVQMAVDDFQQKYGDKAVAKNIDVVSADHQNKPEIANTQAREMYDRKGVDAIFDVPTSSAALAVATVAKQSKRLYFNVGAATTELSGKSCNPYTYEWAYDSYMLANGTGTEVTRQGGKGWYLLYPDYAFGQDMQAKFTAAIAGAGGKVVGKDPTPFPSDNFSTFLLKAASANPKPQVLGALQAGGDLVNLVKQYQQFKLQDKGIKLAVGLMFDSDITSIGQRNLAGTMYTSAWFWGLDAQSQSWAQRFKAKTGVYPTFDQAANYSAATHYLEAVQKAGSDKPDAVSKVLDGMKFSDFFARNAQIRAADHRVVHDAYLVSVKDPSASKENGDYDQLVKTIPAAQAFEQPSSDCRMS
ncbi:ABC transporter substrate-binding protein [Streptomyces sp. NPDC051976]|uniref:ABC transporter substrate-binding protein n=1 Tax=Streptomyces sp. NPDC051976 TaxID=3154947 RepID=UPI00341FEA60